MRQPNRALRRILDEGKPAGQNLPHVLVLAKFESQLPTGRAKLFVAQAGITGGEPASLSKPNLGINNQGWTLAEKGKAGWQGC